ncbi:hypothetical protein ABFT80_10975 [Mesorhizobium sp. SB112]|uniref:hypothetical protein n=1 Tax=Mesorhizobium sp. SB112 TaxID=3151853 RepID=UPI003263EA55
MSILSKIGRLATEFKTARNQYLTERSIRSLPFEIQKDIGWPESYRPNTRRHPRPLIGSWAGDR